MFLYMPSLKKKKKSFWDKAGDTWINEILKKEFPQIQRETPDPPVRPELRARWLVARGASQRRRHTLQGPQVLQLPVLVVPHDAPDLLVIRLHEPADAGTGHVDALRGRLQQRPLRALGTGLSGGLTRGPRAPSLWLSSSTCSQPRSLQCPQSSALPDAPPGRFSAPPQGNLSVTDERGHFPVTAGSPPVRV